MKNVPYSHQCIEEDDINLVVEALKSDFLTQGPMVEEFEKSISLYCGANFAVVFSSGTAALHAAYFAAGLGSADQIISSPLTFLATTNAALFLGAHPIFVDVEVDTANIDPDQIERVISDKTKAIIPVHFAGHPVQLEEISHIAQKYDLLLIEDACHALGARYKNTTIGDCQYSDMAVFSFHPLKSITTGEGGAVLTNNETFYDKLVMFRHHGITKNYKLLHNKSSAEGPWYYEMHYLGNNYRLSDIHCALGLSQLKKLDLFIQKRREIVGIYCQAFKDNPFFELPIEKNYAKSSWHLCPIRLKEKQKNKRAEVFTELRARGLGVQVHYIPVHLQPYYQKLGFTQGDYPNAESFYQGEISIPLWPSMSTDDIDYVIQTLFAVFEDFK